MRTKTERHNNFSEQLKKKMLENENRKRMKTASAASLKKCALNGRMERRATHKAHNKVKMCECE